MNATPWLSQTEIDELCSPLKLPGAQVRYLQRTLKLHVERKPNGQALLMRTELERVLGAGRLGEQQAQNAADIGPNVTALQAWAAKRKHGQKTQGR